jgi:hypothetical protein
VILGAVFTDGLIVQRLTDYIWVGLDSVLNEGHILRVARILYTLKIGLDNLKSYYENIQLTSPSPAESHYFPSITAYPFSKELVQFIYVGFLGNGFDCTTLRAQTLTQPPRDIVVKFVARYGERAHRLLANDGLAPELFYCGSPHLKDDDPSYHSLSMVVMDYIDGDTLTLAKANLNEEAAKEVRLKLVRALALLHDNGLVYGDLRLPNVMITKANELKLIDFDWSGKKDKLSILT